MKLITGPHGAGKTARLIELAGEALAGRRRVAYVTLPHARDHAIRRIAAAHPTAVGLQAVHFQQLYTQLLAAAGRLGEPLDLMGRVAYTARALAEVNDAPPMPGLAGLYARAIAELKRYGRTPDELPRDLDAEVDALARVYAAYERLKGERQDPDDRRAAAIALAEAGARAPYDLLLVDGFRELTPVELRFLRALAAAGNEVVVALPEPPPGLAPDETLPGRSLKRRQLTYPNPVTEARGILTEVKRLLLEGVHPTEVAVIVPAALAPTYRIQARDLGVPLHDESPRTLADLPEGRLLSELLEFPEQPSPDLLARLDPFQPLAEHLTEIGTAQYHALRRAAEELDLLPALEELEEFLNRPGEDPEAWLDAVLEVHPDLANSPWREALRAAGQEALNLLEPLRGGPATLRGWWAAMLRYQRPRNRNEGAVTLVTPQGLGGRRWPHVFIAYAVAGAYDAGVREDYFLPDAPPFRHSWEEAFTQLDLPLRLREQTRALLAEVAAAGEAVTVSYPLAGASSRLEPELSLLDPEKAAAASEPPPAHPRDLAPPRRPRPPQPEPVPLRPRHAGELQTYEECGWKQLLRTLGAEPRSTRPRWQEHLHALAQQARAGEPLDPGALAALGIKPSDAWDYDFWARVPVPELGVDARLHALARHQSRPEAVILHFTDDPIADDKEARGKARGRWNVVLGTYALLRQGLEVTVLVRSLHDGRTFKAYRNLTPEKNLAEGNLMAKMFQDRLARARAALAAMGERPLHHAEDPSACFRCNFKDVCRRDARGAA